MKTSAYAIPLLCLCLAACEEDTYKLRTYVDSTISDGGWIDQQWPTDGNSIKKEAGRDAVLDSGSSQACTDANLALPEICNNVDDNCNNEIDEGFDKLTDVNYCNRCAGCLWLLNKNAYPECVQGECKIASCVLGYVNLDGKLDNGCEHQCLTSGGEICDGADNDCDGTVDNAAKLTPPAGLCRTLGACAGGNAVCKGKLGWQCEYGADVELQPCLVDEDCGPGLKCNENHVCPGVVIGNEEKCDGKDGDCDGNADDPWKEASLLSKLGAWCDLDAVADRKLGACRNMGVFVCNESHDATVCQEKSCMTTADCTNTLNPGMTCSAGKVCTPATAVAETCNGVDDNCDGQVDNNPTDEAWVSVNGAFQIFKYEASRTDATSTAVGTNAAGRPCSVPGRQPWAWVSQQEAQAACKRIPGAKLCTTAQWAQACQGTAGTTFPYGATFVATTCNGRAYSAASDDVLPTDQPAACVSTWGSQTILNMSGNVKEWTALAFDGSGNPTGYEIRGGAADTPSIDGFGAGLSCTYVLPEPTSTLREPTLGFRCCR